MNTEQFKHFFGKEVTEEETKNPETEYNAFLEISFDKLKELSTAVFTEGLHVYPHTKVALSAISSMILSGDVNEDNYKIVINSCTYESMEKEDEEYNKLGERQKAVVSRVHELMTGPEIPICKETAIALLQRLQTIGIKSFDSDSSSNDLMLLVLNVISGNLPRSSQEANAQIDDLELILNYFNY